jgi:pyridoxal phosphate enzyme (YggS family)
VAVTKTWPVEVARAALDAGITLLGENRVQEAEPKIAALPGASWHLVGQLQANKARRAIGLFAAIHSVDSVRLLERIDRLAADDGHRPDLLLQVNVTGEGRKAGFGAARLVGDVAPALPGLDAARVVGLMTIGRIGAGPEAARATFRQLRELRDALEQATGMRLPELSMGMTDDCEAAAAEGATLVRIGTALFGPRHH